MGKSSWSSPSWLVFSSSGSVVYLYNSSLGVTFSYLIELYPLLLGKSWLVTVSILGVLFN